MLFIPTLCFGQGRLYEATIKEMAQRIAQVIPSNTALAISYRTIGGHSQVWSNLQGSLEAELARQRIVMVREPGEGQQIKLTVSDSLRGLLLVAEIPGQDTNAVIILPLTDSGESPARAETSKKVEIRAELLIERDDPILDALVNEQEILVLGLSKLSVYRRSVTSEPPKEMPYELPTALPRDPRGRIATDQAGALTLLFPGSRCTGTIAQGFACYASEDLWPLTADARLRARMVPGRNYFDALSIDLKEARTVTPFFSSARTGDGPAAVLVTEGTDGTTRIYDSSLSETGTSALFGGDFVTIPGDCGPILLQVRRNEADSLVEPFEEKNEQPVPVGGAVRLQGSVTAAWPSVGARATIVCRNQATARYALYLLEVVCIGRGGDAATP